MKKVILSLMALVSLGFSDVKVGDTLSSSGNYGCPTPKEAIHAHNGVTDPSAQGKYGRAFLNSYMKYNSCEKIVYGLEMKVKKVESWGPKGNTSKYEVLMIELSNGSFKWLIL